MTPRDLAVKEYNEHVDEISAAMPPISYPEVSRMGRLKKKVDEVVQVEMADQIAPVKSINDLVKALPGGDDEIIADRFLCKRGGLLFPAPTGIGKSTFVIQSLCLAALGREAYGLQFVRPTKTLYVQAENDESDLAGMRDGIYEFAGFSSEEVGKIGENMLVLTEANRTGMMLIEYLRGVVDEFRPDLVVLDPIFSYLGGNASEQAMVSTFLRNMLNPMLLDMDVAAWLVHHTNKPPSGMEKREWSGGEFAYLGSGSSEWANWARAMLTIRQIGLEDVYELRAGKRGRRLGWEDPAGSPVLNRYIAHAKGSICWQEADWDYVQEQLGGKKKSQGRPSKDVNPDDIIKLDGYPFMSKEGAIEAIAGLAKCGRRTAIDLVDKYMINLGEGRKSTWKVA
jgi:hypothetical protein